MLVDMSLFAQVLDFPGQLFSGQLLGSFDGGQGLDLSSHAIVIAQYKDELGNNVQGAWNEFVNTGRAWALLLGLVVGYLVSKLTSF
jgi:hypothetical protein